MPNLTGALWALLRELALALEEVPQCEPAAEAERDVVAQSLPALLLDPVPPRLRHRTSLYAAAPPVSGFRCSR